MAEPQFNAPPGWPQPPAGWTPPAGWQPEPSWPPAPDGWVFWVDPSTGRPAAAPTVPPVKRRTGRTVALVLGIVGGVLVLLIAAPFIVIGVLGAVNPPTGIAAIDSVDEAVAYYDEEVALTRDYVAEHPWGYLGFEFTDGFRDAELAAELAKPSPDVDAIIELGTSVKITREGWAPYVELWESEYAVDPAYSENATGTEGEAALDAISGGMSAYDPEPGPCNDSDVIACVQDGATVYVNPDLAFLTSAELVARAGRDWESTMHEFGHVIQGKYEYRLRADADYLRLFDIEPPAGSGLILDYDLEHAADCMAAVRLPGYVNGYPGECTPEQLDFAASIWDGSFYRP